MIVKVIKEEADALEDCELILAEIRDDMESDYPEITSYEVEA